MQGKSTYIHPRLQYKVFGGINAPKAALVGGFQHLQLALFAVCNACEPLQYISYYSVVNNFYHDTDDVAYEKMAFPMKKHPPTRVTVK